MAKGDNLTSAELETWMEDVSQAIIGAISDDSLDSISKSIEVLSQVVDTDQADEDSLSIRLNDLSTFVVEAKAALSRGINSLQKKLDEAISTISEKENRAKEEQQKAQDQFAESAEDLKGMFTE